MDHHTYYIDRDSRVKSHPCRYCARDVEVGRVCICAPVQVGTKPAAEVQAAYSAAGHGQVVSRLARH